MRVAVRDTLVAFWGQLNNAIQDQVMNQTATENIKAMIHNQFEVFGYDFMIDEDMEVYLIEVNTNPCLDTSPCPLLQRLITQMID